MGDVANILQILGKKVILNKLFQENMPYKKLMHFMPS